MKDSVRSLSQTLGQQLLERGWHLATAESCTGGGVAAAITAIPGSSAWFEYGVVSYANIAKQRMLGVKAETLEREGAVSEAVVLEMVDGALRVAEADIAVAISGIAGPSGGSPEKPVGSVWFAWGLASGERVTRFRHFDGDRLSVQAQSVATALEGLLALLQAPRKTTV
jgi:nicotinamide-nucleotide amidase